MEYKVLTNNSGCIGQPEILIVLSFIFSKVSTEIFSSKCNPEISSYSLCLKIPPKVAQVPTVIILLTIFEYSWIIVKSFLSAFFISGDKEPSISSTSHAIGVDTTSSS